MSSQQAAAPSSGSLPRPATYHLISFLIAQELRNKQYIIRCDGYAERSTCSPVQGDESSSSKAIPGELDSNSQPCRQACVFFLRSSHIVRPRIPRRSIRRSAHSPAVSLEDIASEACDRGIGLERVQNSGRRRVLLQPAHARDDLREAGRIKERCGASAASAFLSFFNICSPVPGKNSAPATENATGATSTPASPSGRNRGN